MTTQPAIRVHRDTAGAATAGRCAGDAKYRLHAFGISGTMRAFVVTHERNNLLTHSATASNRLVNTASPKTGKISPPSVTLSGLSFCHEAARQFRNRPLTSRSLRRAAWRVKTAQQHQAGTGDPSKRAGDRLVKLSKSWGPIPQHLPSCPAREWIRPIVAKPQDLTTSVAAHWVPSQGGCSETTRNSSVGPKQSISLAEVDCARVLAIVLVWLSLYRS